MRWFADMRLRAKLLISFAAVVSLAALMGIFSISRLTTIAASTEDITKHLAAQQIAGELKAATGDYRIYELQSLEASGGQERAGYEQLMKAKGARIDELVSAYNDKASTDEDRALWRTFKTDWAAYQSEHDKVVALAAQGKADEVHAMATGITQQMYERHSETLDKVIAFNTQGGEAANAEAAASYKGARWGVVAAIFVLAGLGSLVALNVAGQVSRPIEEAAAILKGVAEGDLTHAVQTGRRDELGDMQSALATMIASLSEMVHQVRSGAESVATASAQIAQGNSDLSSRTENQASSLQETAASVEEMAGTVRTNADNAHQANQLASAASDVAARGGLVVTQVVDTMNGIQSSSKKISDIIGVIDGIAFQTNILALNAAVEAARAGEQGRGFAVVAGEVRSLAQRSAQAAREIKTLINDSVEKVNAGSQLVGAAGDTMNDVVMQVRKVTDLVGEIAHASTEQSQGIGQINQAVSQLDQSTQQNAALVEQSMAAAESLKTQARKLSEAVAVFKLRQSTFSSPVAQPVEVRPVSDYKPAPHPAVEPSLKAYRAPAHKPVPTRATAPLPQLPAPSAEPVQVASGNEQDWETF